MLRLVPALANVLSSLEERVVANGRCLRTVPTENDVKTAHGHVSAERRGLRPKNISRLKQLLPHEDFPKHAPLVLNERPRALELVLDHRQGLRGACQPSAVPVRA